MAQHGSVILYCVWTVIISCLIAYLLDNRQDEVAVNRFKLAYAAYNNALASTVNQMSGETGCYYSADSSIPNDFRNCTEFYKRFATNLKVTKYCKNKSFQGGCVPRYDKYSSEKKCAGFSESMFNSGNPTFVMADKSIMNVFNMPSNSPKPLFAVDVNGLQRPNKGGYDLFSFVVMRKQNGAYYFNPNITYCIPVVKGGIEYINDVYK